MKKSKTRFKITEELCKTLWVEVSIKDEHKGGRIEIALYPNYQGIVFESTDCLSDKQSRRCQAALKNRNFIFLNLYEFELRTFKFGYLSSQIAELILLMEPLNDAARRLFDAAKAHKEFCAMLQE